MRSKTANDLLDAAKYTLRQFEEHLWYHPVSTYPKNRPDSLLRLSAAIARADRENQRTAAKLHKLLSMLKAVRDRLANVPH